ncbi:MAG: tRNA lysidine(34) synthetase TilS, partial [Bacteroidales bacterium]|nr:tRNA lysidine(34) synthetase TilS [Bacteroidales bacterium]
MIGKFKSFIESNHLFDKSDRVLLTVSGGMDSMAMAELFSRAGYNFAIIHCNFKLRGREADLDEQLTETMAGRYEVDFFSRSFNTAEIAKDRGESIQMVARDLRYEYFYEVAEEHGFNYIATAHHLDDQIETFFINLTRGTGIAGLHGIRIKQGKIIRPMMFAQKQDIDAFVTENMLAYREDESNRSLKYTRNRIRHELMPAFLEMNPAFREEMTANIKRLAETEVVFKQYISKVKSDVLHQEGEVTAIDIQKLKVLEPLQVFLYEFIMEYGFKKDDVGNIIQSLDGISGKKFLSPT